MKFKNAVLGIILSGLGIATVEAGPQQAQRKSANIRQYETQLQSLQAFIYAAETQRNLVLNGQLTQACAFEDMVTGMATALPKNQLNYPPANVPSDLALPLMAAIEHVQNLIANVTDSACAPPKNNLCCDPSDTADESDVCKTKIGDRCVLVGTRIQGCTADSNDCP